MGWGGGNHRTEGKGEAITRGSIERKEGPDSVARRRRRNGFVFEEGEKEKADTVTKPQEAHRLTWRPPQVKAAGKAGGSLKKVFKVSQSEKGQTLKKKVTREWGGSKHKESEIETDIKPSNRKGKE